MPNANGQRRDFADFVDILQIKDIEGLQDQVDGKANLSHTHVIADVTSLSLALGSKSDTTHSHNFKALLDTPTTYTGQALALVRVKAGENGLEFVSPSVLAPGQVEVGDLIPKLVRKPAPTTGAGQWLPAWLDATIDAAVWSDLQPVLYAVKAEVIDTLTDQFLAVSVSRSSNVASIVLANTDECQLLCDLLYNDLSFNAYDHATDTSTIDAAAYLAWAMTIDLPAAIDFISAGRYKLTAVDRVTRTLSFTLAGADQGATAVTEYIECWPLRKTGTSSVCVWRAVTDAGVIMGRIPGLRNLDAVGKHTHSYNDFSSYGAVGAGGGAQIGAPSANTSTPNTGRTDNVNRTRAVSGFLYVYGGTHT